ncbi:DUF6941 family protein [Cellulomonas sp. T2.31MG-18]|uniref:DUF6941 family protein n=1 Tax=Cellulomonas sp. T2.31MG-18 TaxID=3157619 RepID=UPI00366C31EE
MRVTLLLCDHATVAEGKLYISGGGWNMTAPVPSPSAVALLVSVPWDQANMRHEIRMWLERQDGERVERVDEFGRTVPIQLDGNFEVGRPPGVLSGTPLDVPIALLIPPLPLQPGGRYRWVLEVDGRTQEDWNLPFSVRPNPEHGTGPAALPGF